MLSEQPPKTFPSASLKAFVSKMTPLKDITTRFINRATTDSSRDEVKYTVELTSSQIKFLKDALLHQASLDRSLKKKVLKVDENGQIISSKVKSQKKEKTKLVSQPAEIGSAQTTAQIIKLESSPVKRTEKGKFKTEMCKNWIESDGTYCRYRDRCQFAHGQHQLMTRVEPLHPNYKSKLCASFHSEKGHCLYGSRCQFIHEQRPLDEVRQLHYVHKLSLMEQHFLPKFYHESDSISDVVSVDQPYPSDTKRLAIFEEITKAPALDTAHSPPLHPSMSFFESKKVTFRKSTEYVSYFDDPLTSCIDTHQHLSEDDPFPHSPVGIYSESADFDFLDDINE
ncbi:hypothetical protein FGO68_gene5264 [Halteria grandinella]|uniref:C3H1-type domain-containing protein n=1 Tax=Halteria grandinella TaxID=5974 RepID=A0A8J8NNI3_HALGN|nr:hypothetical protein FGO68_gene5264 [Halteria grandinella]